MVVEERKHLCGGRVGSFVPLDYVGWISKTQLHVGVNINEM